MFGNKSLYGGATAQMQKPMGQVPSPYGAPSPYGSPYGGMQPQPMQQAYQPQPQMPQQPMQPAYPQPQQMQPQMPQQQMNMQQNPMMAQAQQMMQQNPQIMQNQQALMQYMPQIHSEYLQTERGQAFKSEMDAYQQFVKQKLQSMGINM